MVIEAYSENHVMSKTSIYPCYEFLNGGEKVEDEACAGRPPTARNEMMINTAWCIVREECHITVRELTT